MRIFIKNNVNRFMSDADVEGKGIDKIAFRS